jgi:multiple sugar transport system substrate-binding protein
MTSQSRKASENTWTTLRAAATHRRALLKAAGAGVALGAVGLRAPAVLGQAKPFAGTTINGASFQHVFHTYLKEYIPEFEEQTARRSARCGRCWGAGDV